MGLFLFDVRIPKVPYNPEAGRVHGKDDDRHYCSDYGESPVGKIFHNLISKINKDQFVMAVDLYVIP